jgi:hypothetical protein
MEKITLAKPIVEVRVKGSAPALPARATSANSLTPGICSRRTTVAKIVSASENRTY